MFNWFRRNKQSSKNNKAIKEIRDNYINEIKSKYPKVVSDGIEKIVYDFSNGKSESKYMLLDRVCDGDKEIIIHTIRKVLQNEYDFPYPREIGRGYIYYNFGQQGMCNTIVNKK